jgi:coenzyme PQQ synthesis protein D (PqqD)
MTNRVRNFSFAVNPEAAASIHDSGIVILHIGNGFLYASNATGARIWRGVEEQLSLEAIADELSDEYQIDRATAREHVMCFLTKLELHTLIQREAES